MSFDVFAFGLFGVGEVSCGSVGYADFGFGEGGYAFELHHAFLEVAHVGWSLVYGVVE